MFCGAAVGPNMVKVLAKGEENKKYDMFGFGHMSKEIRRLSGVLVQGVIVLLNLMMIITTLIIMMLLVIVSMYFVGSVCRTMLIVL